MKKKKLSSSYFLRKTLPPGEKGHTEPNEGSRRMWGVHTKARKDTIKLPNMRPLAE